MICFLHLLPIFRPTLCGSLNRQKSGKKGKERTWQVGCTPQGTNISQLGITNIITQQCRLVGNILVPRSVCPDFLLIITFLFTSMDNLRYIFGSLGSFQKEHVKPFGSTTTNGNPHFPMGRRILPMICFRLLLDCQKVHT